MDSLAADDPRVIGGFTLRARLGAGGMGRVFLGYSPAGRAVAVKVIHPHLARDGEFAARFRREVAAAEAVNGLYTAPVVAAGPDDDPPWLAAAYVPGPSLQDYVKRFGPLPEPAVWRLAAGLAEALQAVHGCGLVHRDLKPTNVLLAADGPRVIDFGIVSAVDATILTTVGTALGSPSYMSPEQALGLRVGPASDVFSLGSVVTFAATGDPPFGGGDAPAVLFRVARTEPVLDALPPALRDLVAACLAKDPGARTTLRWVLNACQAAGAGSGGAAASFWPERVTAAIAEYQAGLASAGAPAGLVPSGGATWDSGRQRPGTTLASSIGRRRMLAGLGVLAVAGGLTAAGLELASSGGTPASASTKAGSSATSAATGSAAGGTSQRPAAGGTATHGPTASGSPSASARTSAKGAGSTGKPNQTRWVHRTGGPVRSKPVISDGVLYVGSDDGNVYAFDVAAGKPLTTYRTGGAVSGVRVSGGTLFAGSADHTVYAFQVSRGGASWSYRTGAAVATAPAVSGGVVYAGSDDHYVYALHAGTGKLKWRTATGAAVRSGPVVAAGGVVWAGTTDGVMYALNAATGAVRWRYAAAGAIYSGPLAVSGHVYFGCDDHRIYDLSLDREKSSWRYKTGGVIRGALARAGKIVYAGSADSFVYALGLSGGGLIWKFRTGGPVYSGPAVAGGVVYAGADNGFLYEIHASTGRRLRQYKADGPIRSRILASGGLVYFGTQAGRVYAVRP